MKLPNIDISSALKSAQIMTMKNLPGVLTGIGIAVYIGGTVYSVVHAETAFDQIEKTKKKVVARKEKRKKENEDTPKPVEVCYDICDQARIIGTGLRVFAPGIIAAVVGTACIVGGQNVMAKRNAALMAAYTLSETKLADYTRAAKEVVGEKQEAKIKERTAVNTSADANFDEDTIIQAGGKTLCWDNYLGRPFRSDIELIRQGIASANLELSTEDFISLNDTYYHIHPALAKTSVGDYLGFNTQGDTKKILLHESSMISPTGVPMYVLDFENAPEANYDFFG